MKKFVPICLICCSSASWSSFTPAARLATADETPSRGDQALPKSVGRAKEVRPQGLQRQGSLQGNLSREPSPRIAYSKLTGRAKGHDRGRGQGMTSEFGRPSAAWKSRRKTPDGSCFLTFFGEPSAKTPFAWRIGMHHLTLIFAEFGGEKSNEFGPILLGGNPVKTMWDEEEKLPWRCTRP